MGQISFFNLLSDECKRLRYGLLNFKCLMTNHVSLKPNQSMFLRTLCGPVEDWL